MTQDAFGNIVKNGDIVVYGSGQGHRKAGFRVGVVIDSKKPTVVPFERAEWGYSEDEHQRYMHFDSPHWFKMRVFGFPDRKQGDFAIVPDAQIQDKDLLNKINEVRRERKV